jgi:hypothetical protein
MNSSKLFQRSGPKGFSMSRLVRVAVVCGLVALGYAWGRMDAAPLVCAQEQSTLPSEETAKKIQTANDALRLAVDALKNESRYNLATKSMNVFAIMTGGVDAVDDLESGRGVDPETFAALYAGEANDEVAQHLSKDEDGRLTYKNRPIRIYPVSRLKKLYTQRLILTGEIQVPKSAR